MKHEEYGKCYLLVHDGACHLSDLRQAELAGVQQDGFPAQPDLDLEGNALRPREGARRSDHRRHAHMNPLVLTHNHVWTAIRSGCLIEFTHRLRKLRQTSDP